MNKLSRREITCTMSADFFISFCRPAQPKTNAQQELLGSTGFRLRSSSRASDSSGVGIIGSQCFPAPGESKI